MSFRASEVYNI